MKTANVVIGANYGDEGKGRFTDYFTRPGGLVVRFNGGAQAGHTVVREDGVRHTFGHFGSGTFKGAATFLSRFFVVNPLLWQKEYHTLQSKGVTPILYADPLAPLTTPYDMLINQLVERHRGDKRHGSCGAGVNETVTRNANPEFVTKVDDVRNRSRLERKLSAIRNEWVPFRMRQLTGEVFEGHEYIRSETLKENFVAACTEFWSKTAVTGSEVIASAPHVVFEGAQGLLLDEDHYWFPYVTRSKTGLINAYLLANEAGIEHLDVTYVTRAYLTRHGAGPLPNEIPQLSYDVQDPTNVQNEWQGTLRFANLNVNLVADSIKDDLAPLRGKNMQIVFDIAVTCLDQIKGPAFYYKDHVLRMRAASDMVADLFVSCGITQGYACYGPTGDDRVFVFNVKEKAEQIA